MSKKGWSRPFDDPLPRGRQLVTLKDAADYIMKLPKAEQNLPEWQTAIRCLLGAAEGGDFLMHARIGVMRALNRFTATMPACVLVSAMGFVEPSVSGSSSPSGRRRIATITIW
jgi:hypothetical protein